ncbi:hypothetical protein H2198_003091 [Neophaeococcomyces mojaviensis]|uniref:Uncharacterized protein n=1 Tax=Neophaeococcomyces mojaviensis TaxID=3383035 RepID=A0ACC3ACE1_9EURO|nr:hypothetical protein H2198_003091 [Knufia sp. JES_112]
MNVSMMSRIYGGAKLVIGWLGVRSDTSDLAIDTIHMWKQQGGLLKSRGDDDIDDILLQISENTSLLSPEIAEAIVQLFERVWWYRQWISQEIILAEDILIFCGEKTISWTDVLGAHEVWSTLREPDYAGHLETWQQLWLGVMVSGIFELFEQLRALRAAGDTILLDHLLPTFRGFQASDPRDKVFALLGFASDDSKPSPDYRLSARELYLRYATTELRNSHDVNILRHCFFNEKSFQDGIPSWVPDWSNSDIPASLSKTMYNCVETEFDMCQYSISDDLHMLRIPGTVVTKVARSVPASSPPPPQHLFPLPPFFHPSALQRRRNPRSGNH